MKLLLVTFVVLIKLSNAREYRICELLHDLTNKHDIPSLEAAQIACGARFFTELRTDFRSSINGQDYFGIFGISNDCCNSQCEMFLNDDITDDIKCVRSTGEFRNLPKYSENNCDKRAKNYILDCFGNSRDKKIDALAPSTPAPLALKKAMYSSPAVTYRTPTTTATKGTQRTVKKLTRVLRQYFSNLNGQNDQKEWIKVMNHKFGLSIQEIFQTSCLAYDSIVCRLNFDYDTSCRAKCKLDYSKRCDDILESIEAALNGIDIHAIDNIAVLNSCDNIDDLTREWLAQNNHPSTDSEVAINQSPIQVSTEKLSTFESSSTISTETYSQTNENPVNSLNKEEQSTTNEKYESGNQPQIPVKTDEDLVDKLSNEPHLVGPEIGSIKPEEIIKNSSAEAVELLGSISESTPIVTVTSTTEASIETSPSTIKPVLQPVIIQSQATNEPIKSTTEEMITTLEEQTTQYILEQPVTIETVTDMVNEDFTTMIIGQMSNSTELPDSIGLIVNHCELLSFFNTITQLSDEQVAAYLCFSYDILWCTMNKDPNGCSKSCLEADEIIKNDPLCSPFFESIKNAGLKLRDSGIHKFNDYNSNCRKGAHKFIEECRNIGDIFKFSSMLPQPALAIGLEPPNFDFQLDAGTATEEPTVETTTMIPFQNLKPDEDNLSLMESQYPMTTTKVEIDTTTLRVSSAKPLVRAPIIGYRLNSKEQVEIPTKKEIPPECELLSLLAAMNLTKPETVSYLCLAYDIAWCTMISTRKNCDASCLNDPECDERYQAMLRVGAQMKSLLDIAGRQDLDCPIGTLKVIRTCQNIDENIKFSSIETLPAAITMLNVPMIESTTLQEIEETTTIMPDVTTIEPLIEETFPDLLQKSLCQLHQGLQDNSKIQEIDKKIWFCFSYDSLSCFLNGSTDCNCNDGPEIITNSNRCQPLLEHISKLAKQLSADMMEMLKRESCTENYENIISNCSSAVRVIPITTYHPLFSTLVPKTEINRIPKELDSDKASFMKDIDGMLNQVKEEVEMTTQMIPETEGDSDFYRLSIFNQNTTSSLNFTLNFDKLSIRDIIFTPINDKKDFNVTFRFENSDILPQSPNLQ